MRKLTIAFCGLTLMGGALITPPAAFAHDDTRTLRGKVTDVEQSDRGERGPSQGDSRTVRFDMFDHGDDAGSGVNQCVLTDVNRHRRDFTVHCLMELNLDDGQLRAEGTRSSDDTRDGVVTLDITGGNGEYRDADGEIRLEPVGGRQRDRGGPRRGQEFKLTVDLH